MHDRIPFGTPTLIAAAGGSGKGMFCVMPCESLGGGPCEPGSVIMVTPEDDASYEVANRLEAAGADSANVYNLTEVDDDGTPFEIPDHIDVLRSTIEEINSDPSRPSVRLIILDPLAAMLRDKASIATNAAARRVYSPLAKVAADYGVALVVTVHTVKSGAVQGSQGLVDVARIVLTLTTAEQSPGLKILRPFKANLIDTFNNETRLRIVGDGDGVHAVIHGPTNHSAPEPAPFGGTRLSRFGSRRSVA